MMETQNILEDRGRSRGKCPACTAEFLIVGGVYAKHCQSCQIGRDLRDKLSDQQRTIERLTHDLRGARNDAEEADPVRERELEETVLNVKEELRVQMEKNVANGKRAQKACMENRNWKLRMDLRNSKNLWQLNNRFEKSATKDAYHAYERGFEQGRQRTIKKFNAMVGKKQREEDREEDEDSEMEREMDRNVARGSGERAAVPRNVERRTVERAAVPRNVERRPVEREEVSWWKGLCRRRN
jgi:hypothetical protein